MRRNRSLFAILVALLGAFFAVLAVSFILALFGVFVLSVVMDSDFNKLFLVVGLPVTLFLTGVWFWRNSLLVKRVIGRREF
ncbi:hypothetical protein [Pseudomonas chlororaphis]|uniref:hypothetical protein n=1 Tax=Pseudomonas chlororaphis TaxID=587753 RepID=UPI000F57A74B|nr:hypothetical protein [Pseudomonas chlororaphis]QFS56052.1 hypothetical protein FD951_16420 [Pseudomonas chlororaphis subsp. aurantiaca]